METPEQKFNPNLLEEKKKYLDQGFIDGSVTYDVDLLEKMWNKKITAVFIGKDTPEIYSDLELTEFPNDGGYGFKLPDGHLFLILKYNRDSKEPIEPLENWLFKIE